MTRPLRVLSLFDSTGTWASFAPPGAEVYAVDMAPRPLEWSRGRGGPPNFHDSQESDP